ncbi:unnamed protein product [Caenorhabditis auriculariae]|uniref:Uncharacterized protein n=1 Tax=Caenorhabditis auriculariae TaxID=2777116 RepID=A0A8S1H445_9PELO|nr:unnamed protein product [Caenorhabditis auriculariae]
MNTFSMSAPASVAGTRTLNRAQKRNAAEKKQKRGEKRVVVAGCVRAFQRHPPTENGRVDVVGSAARPRWRHANALIDGLAHQEAWELMDAVTRSCERCRCCGRGAEEVSSCKFAEKEKKN